MRALPRGATRRFCVSCNRREAVHVNGRCLMADGHPVVVTACELASDEGSSLIFDGHDEHDRPVRFLADGEEAVGLLASLQEHGATTIELRAWQLLTA